MSTKIFYRIILVMGIIFLASCSGKVKCPVCQGEGEFTYNGQDYFCSACDGEGKVTAEKCVQILKSLNSGSESYGSSSQGATQKYCAMCLGTGVMKTTSYPYSFKCSSCNGTGVSQDDRYNTTKPLHTCVYCNGSGRNEFSGEPCSACSGYGKTMFSSGEQDRLMEKAQGNGNLCSACGGSGKCPVCHGSDGHNRFGDNFCTSCGNTGKCPWCRGMGYVK